MALLDVAPALTPDAALALGVGRAFGLLGGRARLVARAQRNAPSAAEGVGRDGESWTDAKGHRHTRIGSMDSLYAAMPRRE